MNLSKNRKLRRNEVLELKQRQTLLEIRSGEKIFTFKHIIFKKQPVNKIDRKAVEDFKGESCMKTAIDMKGLGVYRREKQ